MKKELGVVVGRFQPLHKGHEKIIDLALENCKKVLVLVGSAQEHWTERNPFSYNFRRLMLKTVYGDRIMIAPVEDIGLGNNRYWGTYLLGVIATETHAFPDVFVFGQEGVCEKWFSDSVSRHITQIVVPRDEYQFSGTEAREALVRGDKKTWKEHVNPKLWQFYSNQKLIIDNL